MISATCLEPLNNNNIKVLFFITNLQNVQHLQVHVDVVDFLCVRQLQRTIHIFLNISYVQNFVTCNC